MIDLNQSGAQWEPARIDLSTFLSDAVNVLRENGLDVDAASLDASGNLVRCPLIDKPKGKDGSYWVRTDARPTAWWMNFVTGDSGAFGAGGGKVRLTDDDRAVIEAERQRRDLEAKERHAEAAQKAAEIYEAASRENVNEHPYAARKGLDFAAMGARRGGFHGHDCLTLPMRDEQGNITSLQYIANGKVLHDGATDKHFLAGGKKGLLSIGGDFRGAACVAIVEGVATGGAVHDATGLPVVCAFDAGNLKAAGEVVRKLAAPGAEILFMADDDRETPGNPGIASAEKAAQAVGGRVILPALGRKADFWDVWHERGSEAVRACIEAAHAAQAPSIWDSPADIAAMLATQPEPMPWLFTERVPFGRGGALAALGGTGKTTLVKALAVGCITGRLPMDGWKVERTGKVVLVLTEDTHAEFHEDLHRLCYGMTTRERELVARNLVVYPLAGKDTRLLTKSPRGIVEKSPLYQSLIAKIQAIGGVVLVGLDPALGITEGDEMNQADQRALGRAVDDLAVTVGATCILLSHSAKALLNANELGSHSSRGGGALTDALRFEITMRGMTATEATAHGIEDLEERLHLVQVAITKGNRVPPAAKVPVWLRYDSGTLVSAGLVEPEKKPKADGGKLPKSAALVFEAIKEATMEHGQIDDATGRPYVAMDDLRTAHKELYTQRNPARTDRAERMALQDGSARLIELGMVESDGLTVSFAGPGAEVHFANVAAAIAERQGRKFGRERKFSEVSSAQDGSETAEGSGSVPLYKGTFLPQTSGGDLQAFPDEVTL